MPSPIVKNRPQPWNKGLLVGQKKPLEPKHVWSIRVRLEIAGSKRDLAIFNLARLIRQRGWRAWCKAPMRRRIRLRSQPHHLQPANATPAMTDDTILPFSFPAVRAKKVTAAFDGGRLTSNGGVMLLAM